MNKRIPTTNRGLKAKNTLLNKSVELFYNKGYHQTSIPDITKEANLSISSFYQYFNNKEDLLVEIITVFINDFLKELEVLSDYKDNTDKLIYDFYRTFLNFILINKKKYKILRETEFTNYPLAKDFYSRLVKFTKEHLFSKISSENLKDELSYALLGTVYFVALKKIDWDNSSNIDFFSQNLQTFFKKGIDLNRDYIFDPHWKGKINVLQQEQLLTRGEKTQKDILRVAEDLFGVNGFWKTHVVDIANQVGIGHGTFYLYFESKIELLRKLVKEINKDLRYTVYSLIKDSKDRKDVEVKGLLAFSEYIKHHKNAYRVVREAEFVDRNIGKWYYNRIVEPYAKKLKEAMDKNEIINIDPEILALAIIGIGHFLGLRWVVWNNHTKQEIPFNSLEENIKIVLWGFNNEKN